MIGTNPDFDIIRTEVRRLCDKYGNEYWRSLEPDRYPTEFVADLSKQIPYFGLRHCVKPGITGWAQLRYAYGASVEDSAEKLKFDLYYAKNHSLVFDLMILMQTVEVVLFGKGAR